MGRAHTEAIDAGVYPGTVDGGAIAVTATAVLHICFKVHTAVVTGGQGRTNITAVEAGIGCGRPVIGNKIKGAHILHSLVPTNNVMPCTIKRSICCYHRYDADAIITDLML